ncbi:Replication protein A 70 kDa DNA-binding subunit A [Rhynchospora pubera]|uniref:Replication protein A subunit n=1 Tax=Rhynchospora pubera TaxID=906938 RepID=A0AAV8DLH8_9POAL|nr:Replication protein A 70 kDa DNA-binding subunit A [Rhynchospora pubera]KAJ4820201.1 Replication protein A 70 kDa DNA-binding subunit A [Rhynchospora pubera]
MEKLPTEGGIATILANPSPDSASDVPEIVLQVVDLKPIGNSSTRYTFMASDGKMKVKAMLPTHFASEINSGNLQNLGLIRVLDYTLNSIPNQTEKALIVTKCEVVASSFDSEIKSEVKKEAEMENEATKLKKEEAAPSIVLKPKQETVVKSAMQIVKEERGNAAPAARLSMTRRVHPLVSLNPYQGNWTIKVRVTNKGNLRTYRNAKGEGHVFNVELTDEDGTQIQATMFNEAAKKFYPKFELGKVYYISKGSLRIANKQFKTVQNDYEMTLNENALVEEAEGEVFIPETKYNFVKIDQLGSYVNSRELTDVIGIVQNVSSTLSIRRKSDNETVPKRDITIADDSNKTVVVSLWNDLATNIGQELLDMVDTSPVVAIKSLKVGEFQGVSLSTVSKSVVQINPDLPEAHKLRTWYDSEGKGASMASIGSDMVSPNSKNGARSMYSDRVFLSHITSDPSLGHDKPEFFSINAYISLIKGDQTMWYRACKTCNKKVSEATESGYWCESCGKSDDQCSLRYIMILKVSDPTGEAWLSVFNEQAEKIIGCSADELERIKNEEGDDQYQMKLKEAMWVPHLFRVSVTQNEYMGEKRQRITVRSQALVDPATESKYLLEEIAKLSV